VPGHDLIVIGGSAGSVEALSALFAQLPADLPAAVCVVIHQPPFAPSRLPGILKMAGPLPAVPARDGAPLLPGTVHVGVPDQHLLVVRDGGAADGPGTIRLTRGPRENRTRPAVDPLFRSAALAYGPRAIAVVLSGALDDGTAGMWAVRDRGGLAVVQDPADAAVASMPSSALTEVGADHVAPASELGPLLGQLARLPVDTAEADAATAMTAVRTEMEREVAQAFLDERTHTGTERYGQPSRFVCPDCGGVLWNTSSHGGPLHFRCDTGHAYSPAALAEGQTEAVEAALWASLRALENKAELARSRADRARQRGLDSLVDRYTVQLDATQQHAAAVRALLRMDGRTGMGPAG
jgi:two-component system, chemotaxis family, protein-glutamate methylesterase/glutaminase